MEKSDRGCLVISAIPILLLIAVGVWIGWPSLQFHMPTGRERMALKKVKGLGLACLLYAGDHGEALPKSLQKLIPKYIPAGFLDKGIREPASPGEEAFIYFPGLSRSGPPDLPLVASQEHKGRRALVLVDQTGSMVNEEVYQTAVARYEAWKQKNSAE